MSPRVQWKRNPGFTASTKAGPGLVELARRGAEAGNREAPRWQNQRGGTAVARPLEAVANGPDGAAIIYRSSFWHLIEFGTSAWSGPPLATRVAVEAMGATLE